MKITFLKLKWLLKKYGSHLTFNEPIELDMTELPAGIRSITVNNGQFYGNQLTKLPDGITINASYYVYLNDLTIIGNNVTIKSGYVTFLNSLTVIGNNATIETGEDIWLDRLTTIGNDVVIKSDHSVYLFDKLTTIGENVIINSDENGDNITIKPDAHIFFNNVATKLSKIQLTDARPIPIEVVQFLIEKKITVKCSDTSPLVNLAFDGVLVEIVE